MGSPTHNEYMSVDLRFLRETLVVAISAAQTVSTPRTALEGMITNLLRAALRLLESDAAPDEQALRIAALALRAWRAFYADNDGHMQAPLAR